MPFLQWVNDDEARRATKAVPFRLMKEEAVYGDATQAKDNLLIQGDNLDALRALLPFYRGKVKCIFIDPPYNTGSAFEHYDDNLEHSKWLSLIYPRLQLIREFLSDDGSIWVSIDDTEGHYLKVIMDEIFGRNAFVSSICWQNRYSRSNDAVISVSHNSIHLYAKNRDRWKLVRNKLDRTAEQSTQYKNPDNDPKGPWRAIPWDAPNVRENLSYPIKTFAGTIKYPPKGRCWSRTEDQWLELVEKGLAYFGKNGDGSPSFKRYLSEGSKIVPNTWWRHEEVGHTDEAKKESIALFGQSSFSTPKPERLIHQILTIATNPGDLVLDSFLGSGTTAAVAHKMGRHYIGIEMGEHAKTHCIPRLQKVIDGEQGGISQAVNWQGGGGFTFYTLDEPVFDELGLINPKVDFKTLAAYLWQRETKEPSVPEYSPYLGSHQGTAYYLLFNGVLSEDNLVEPNVLTYSVLKALLEDYPFNGPKVIYADACAGISDHELKKLQVTFKQIPYDILQ